MESEQPFSIDEWERNRSFSSYSSYLFPDTEKKPGNATRRGNSWVPRAPDGFTIGNSKIFAAIGVPLMDIEHIHEFYTSNDFSIPFIKDFNVARLSLLVGPEKKTVHLQNLPNVFKVQDFTMRYENEGETCLVPAARASSQEAKRLKGTSILLSRLDYGNKITMRILDFCPRCPDDPVLFRFISMRNMGGMLLKKVSLDISFENKANSWSWNFKKDQNVLEITEFKDNTCFLMKVINLPTGPSPRVALSCFDEHPGQDAMLKARDEQQTGEGAGYVVANAALPDLQPGDETCILLAFSMSNQGREREEQGKTIDHAHFIRTLHLTEECSRAKMLATRFSSTSEQLNDLVDSILSMMLDHVSDKGIHTGSVYYAHGHAWVRDNYWVQVAFHQAGRHEQAIMNARFFLKSWLANGKRFSNSHDLFSGKGSNPNCELLVELPAYYVLMIIELFKWIPDVFQHVDENEVRELVTAFINETTPNEDGLFPLNSDETWIWCCDVQETGAVLDNSTLTIATLVGIKKWMPWLLDEKTMERANNLLDTCENALISKMIVPGKNTLAAAREDNGLHDESAITNPTCRPFVMDIIASLPKALGEAAMNSLVSCWKNCMTMMEGGEVIVRSHSATAAMTGNSLGYALAALGHVNARVAGDALLSGILAFVNCTGSVNEIHDIFDPSWGTERRRLWDSAAILQGIYKYILGARGDHDNVSFKPYCPAGMEKISIDGYPVKGNRYSFRLERSGEKHLCAIKVNDIEIARYEGVSEVSINKDTGACMITPVKSQDYRFPLKKKHNVFWDTLQSTRSIQVIHDPGAACHAREIQRQLLFSRNFFVKTSERKHDEKVQSQYHDISIVISKSIPIAGLDTILTGLISQELQQKGYSIFKINAGHVFRFYVWIPLNNDVYKDTHKFIQDIRAIILPSREKPMSMHPHGFLRFSDKFGSKILGEIPLTITIKPLRTNIEGPGPDEFVCPSLFVQGEEKAIQDKTTMTWAGTLDLKVFPRSVPKKQRLIAISSITPFSPFDLSAAGIASGKNAIKIVIYAESDIPLVTEMTFNLPQTWHPQNFRAPQWERLFDPVKYIRNPNGTKDLIVKIRQGMPVNRHIESKKISRTSRQLTFVFIKYP